jgi:hypothetical protein
MNFELMEFLVPFGPKTFYSRFLYKNINTSLYRTINQHFVLFGCETWQRCKGRTYIEVLHNKLLRKVLVPEVQTTGDWMRLHNEEIQMYTGVIKSGNMGWAGHVASVGQTLYAYEFLMGNLREEFHLRGISVDARIILELICMK